MPFAFHYKNDREIFRVHEGKVPYLSFRALDAEPAFLNAFSTRLGGVSEGDLCSMNLTYAKEGEKPEHVMENYRRIADATGADLTRMVVSQQTHTTNIMEATEADFGKGVLRERGYTDIDGLITDIPGCTLVTFYADCVPLYIVDPKKQAVGLSHSGWRGTAGGMGEKTIRKMTERYGSDPEDLICCIGPSICSDCFEVGAEVAEAFRNAFPERHHAELIRRKGIDPESGEEKFLIDLWRANELVFLSAGVRPERIHTTNLCTMCNPELLWSHRVCGTKRGNLAAFLGVREH